VLVAGGESPAGIHGVAEQFDPSSNSWSALPSMSSSREIHAAVSLLDGRVFITGGFDGIDALDSIEVFDPSTATWASGGTLTAKRFAHAAVRLRDGRVLVTGGSNFTVGALADVEVWSPGAAVALTPAVGGPGGNPFAYVCPSGWLATRLVGQAGDDIDRMELWCSEVLPSGFGPSAFADGGGPTNSTPYDLTCPVGMALTGIHGLAGQLAWGGTAVDTLGIRCTDPAATSTFVSPTVGNQTPFAPGSTTPFTFSCPAGKTVVSVIGSQGSLLDRISVLCR
jgi:hypothetical protein